MSGNTSLTLCEDICNRGICAAAAVLSAEFPFWAVVQKQKQILHRSLTKPRFLKAHPPHTVNSVAPLEARQKLYTIPLQGIVHYCSSGANKKSQCCVKGKEINKSLVITTAVSQSDPVFLWWASAHPAMSVSLHYDIITCYQRFTCGLPPHYLRWLHKLNKQVFTEITECDETKKKKKTFSSFHFFLLECVRTDQPNNHIYDVHHCCSEIQP